MIDQHFTINGGYFKSNPKNGFPLYGIGERAGRAHVPIDFILMQLTFEYSNHYVNRGFGVYEIEQEKKAGRFNKDRITQIIVPIYYREAAGVLGIDMGTRYCVLCAC